MENKLTIAITLLSSKDTDEERIIHPKSDSIEVMINHNVINIKIICKNRWEIMNSSSIMFIYCIINVIK